MEICFFSSSITISCYHDSDRRSGTLYPLCITSGGNYLLSHSIGPSQFRANSLYVVGYASRPDLFHSIGSSQFRANSLGVVGYASRPDLSLVIYFIGTRLVPIENSTREGRAVDHQSRSGGKSQAYLHDTPRSNRPYGCRRGISILHQTI